MITAWATRHTHKKAWHLAGLCFGQESGKESGCVQEATRRRSSRLQKRDASLEVESVADLGEALSVAAHLCTLSVTWPGSSSRVNS